MRRLVSMICLTALSACAVADPTTQATKDLGDFDLCYTYTFAGKAPDPGPLSRKATAQEWEDVLLAEIRRRFDRYDGGKCYYIAASVDGYGLAQPGVPLVFSPKSGLVLRATIWDHELQKPLNKGGERLEVFLVDQGGLFNDRAAQMEALARNGAAEIERFMLENPEWFDGDSNAEIVAASEAAAR